MELKYILIPLCAFYINLCTFGYMRSGGVLYMAFIKNFNCTYAQASWPTVQIGSWASFFIGVAGFLAHYFNKQTIILAGVVLSSTAIGLSAFVDTIQLVIFLSAIQGIGNGLFVGLLPIIISENFDKGRAIACGFSYSGCTLASFLFPPFLQAVIENFNLKIAVLALSFIAITATFAIIPLKSKLKSTELKEEPKNLCQQLSQDLKILNLFPFWIVTVIYIVFIYVFVIFIIILPDLAVSRGHSKQSAAILVSIYSIGDFAGRLIPGYLSLKNIINNQTFYLYSIITMGSLFFLIEQYAISFSTFSILCVSIGFVTGIQMTLPAVVMTEFIGIEKTTIGFGFTNIFSGLIALSRPLLIDYIKQTTDSYNYLLLINSILCLICTLPFLLYNFKKFNQDSPVISYENKEKINNLV